MRSTFVYLITLYLSVITLVSTAGQQDPFCLWNRNDQTIRLVALLPGHDHATYQDVAPARCNHLLSIPRTVCIITNRHQRHDITSDSAELGNQMNSKPTAKLTWDIPQGLEFILITPDESAEGTNKCYLQLSGTFITPQKAAARLCACWSSLRHSRTTLHGNIQNRQFKTDIYTNGAWEKEVSFRTKRLSAAGLMAPSTD